MFNRAPKLLWSRDHAASGWRSRCWVGSHELVVYDTGDWYIFHKGVLFLSDPTRSGPPSPGRLLQGKHCVVQKFLMIAQEEITQLQDLDRCRATERRGARWATRRQV
jgi:hypothetical protein